MWTHPCHIHVHILRILVAARPGNTRIYIQPVPVGRSLVLDESVVGYDARELGGAHRQYYL